MNCKNISSRISQKKKQKTQNRQADILEKAITPIELSCIILSTNPYLFKNIAVSLSVSKYIYIPIF